MADRPFWDSRSGRYLFHASTTNTWYYWQSEAKQWLVVASEVSEPVPPAPATHFNADQQQRSRDSQSVPQLAVAGQVQAIYGGQRTCPVMDEELGAHGTPIPVNVRGQTIYVCCKGCIREVQAAPDRYLAKVAEERARLGANPAKKANVR